MSLEQNAQRYFDIPIDRKSTRAIKWLEVEGLVSSVGEPVIPLWIADMDFNSPPAVLNALRETLEHGALGYSEWPEDFPAVFRDWQASRHYWQISPQWLLSCQSVITALDVIIRTCTQPDDDILVLTPGFGTFNRVIDHTGRRQINVPLVELQNHYHLDLKRLEAQITPRSRMLILCNPHNPVGKVWSREELIQIAQLCQRHGLLLVSDDVHQDLVIGDIPYTPIASLDEAFADFIITFTSPCKTFNLSGLPVAQLIIKNSDLREKLRHNLYQLSVHQPDMLAMAGCVAAYRHGGEWLDALLYYLKGNYALLEQGLAPLKDVTLFHLEGTYLAWVDFRKTGLSQSALQSKLVKEAGVFMNNGLKFGEAGEGFMRLNFALPRAELIKVIERLNRCFD